MTGTMAVVGALGGAAMCAVAGRFGIHWVLAAAVNDEQREVLRQIFTCAGGYAAAVMGLVVLGALQVLPHWIYVAAVVLWFAPLLPGLMWAHQRLDAATGHGGLAAPMLAA